MKCNYDCFNCVFDDCIRGKTSGKEAGKSYYQRNRERLLVYYRAYRAKNREKIAAYNRKYYAENRVKIIARSRAQHEAHKQEKDG